MSSTGNAQDTYRVGTRDAGPVCKFTGLGCAAGTDCRSCNVPSVSVNARLLETMAAKRVSELYDIEASEEARCARSPADLEEMVR